MHIRLLFFVIIFCISHNVMNASAAAAAAAVSSMRAKAKKRQDYVRSRSSSPLRQALDKGGVIYIQRRASPSHSWQNSPHSSLHNSPRTPLSQASRSPAHVSLLVAGFAPEQQFSTFDTHKADLVLSRLPNVPHVSSSLATVHACAALYKVEREKEASDAEHKEQSNTQVSASTSTAESVRAGAKKSCCACSCTVQ